MNELNSLEVEIKVAIADLAAIAVQLKQLHADLEVPRVYERNVRYENASRSLTAASKVVRLRQDTRTRLTWKEPSASNTDISVNVRTELEVTVSDFDTMDLILQKLGYIPAWTYEKYRTTYALDGCEIVLDELPYGNFVEIEGSKAAIDALRARLNIMHLPNITRSYSSLFGALRQKFRLSMDNLTFAEFEGVELPSDWIDQLG